MKMQALKAISLIFLIFYITIWTDLAFSLLASAILVIIYFATEK